VALEEIRVRDCACPNTPHGEEGDIVFLAPTLSAEGGIAAEQDMASTRDSEELTRKWLISFVRFGARGWNLLDEDGSEVPFDVDALLADWAIARPVAIRAGELYQASVIAPFQQQPAKRSPTGRTAATTSARRSRTRSPSGSPSPMSSGASEPSRA
jgi:hypothetical protein